MYARSASPARGGSGRYEPGRSDADFLVEFEDLPPERIAATTFGLKQELEALLGRPVDLVLERAIRNPWFREEVERTRANTHSAGTGQVMDGREVRREGDAWRRHCMESWGEFRAFPEAIHDRIRRALGLEPRGAQPNVALEREEAGRRRRADARGGPISPDDITRVVSSCGGEPVNCYPGEPGAACHSMAVFVSLTAKAYARGRGHLSFRQALECFVQHMQGGCAGRTHTAIVIVDSWDPEAFEDWRANIEQVRKSGAFVEVYLVDSNSVTYRPV